MPLSSSNISYPPLYRITYFREGSTLKINEKGWAPILFDIITDTKGPPYIFFRVSPRIAGRISIALTIFLIYALILFHLKIFDPDCLSFGSPLENYGRNKMRKVKKNLLRIRGNHLDKKSLKEGGKKNGF